MSSDLARMAIPTRRTFVSLLVALAAQSLIASSSLAQLSASLLPAHNGTRFQINSGLMPAPVGFQPVPAPPLNNLVWSAALETAAQTWANTCLFEHDRVCLTGPNIGNFCTSQADCTAGHFCGNPVGQGENLAADGYVGTPPAVTAGYNGWAAESVDYDYATNTCAVGQQCGHYTQIAWDSTTDVGCGVMQCPNCVAAPCTAGTFRQGINMDQPVFPGFAGTVQYLVCRYAPPGNFLGQQPYATTTTSSTTSTTTTSTTTSSTTTTTTTTTSTTTSTTTTTTTSTSTTTTTTTTTTTSTSTTTTTTTTTTSTTTTTTSVTTTSSTTTTTASTTTSTTTTTTTTTTTSTTSTTTSTTTTTTSSSTSSSSTTTTTSSTTTTTQVACPCFTAAQIAGQPLQGSCIALNAWAGFYTEYYGWPLFNVRLWQNFCWAQFFDANQAVLQTLTPAEFLACRALIVDAANNAGVACQVF